MADDPTTSPNPHATQLHSGQIADELRKWASAIRNGIDVARNFGFEYERTPYNSRSHAVARIDAWIGAIVESWEALKVRIEADHGVPRARPPI